MFKEFFKKNGEENDKKKNIENIIVFIIILIINARARATYIRDTKTLSVISYPRTSSIR